MSPGKTLMGLQNLLPKWLIYMTVKLVVHSQLEAQLELLAWGLVSPPCHLSIWQGWSYHSKTVSEYLTSHMVICTPRRNRTLQIFFMPRLGDAKISLPPHFIGQNSHRTSVDIRGMNYTGA